MTTLFLAVVVFFAIIHQLFGCLLLVGNGLLLALAGTGVVLGALAADGKADAVADATVATDIHEALDVHLDGGAEFALDLVVLTDFGADLGDLVIIPLADLGIVRNAAGIQDGAGGGAADTEDIGQTDFASLVVR